jgi:cysteine desulfurase
MAISAHKVGGPVGVGALLVAPGMDLSPVVDGGRQERGLRSGTLDARGAAGVAAALGAALDDDLGALEDMLAPLDRLVAQHPDLTSMTPEHHLPGLRLLTVRGATGETLTYLLDQKDIAVSSGSACTAGVARPSQVLLAMGCDAAQASSALRVSLGHGSTADDVARLVAVLPEVVERAQAAA